MSKPPRDPAELAAFIEQSVAAGRDLVDYWRMATGKTPKNQSKALALAHRKELEANRRQVRRYRRRQESAQAQVTGGAVVAGVGGAIGLFDVVAELGSSSGAPGPAWMWLGAAGIGLFVSLRGRMRLRRVGPAPRVIEPVAPPPALPKGRSGSVEISRFTSVRVQVMSMAPALDRLYPGAGDELRRADAEAAVPLTALAERIVVLDQLQRELPGTSAARQAAESTDVLRARLAEGCDTYDELLAAAARLLAAPDATRSTAAVLGPAVTAMVAYAHGLQRAADL